MFTDEMSDKERNAYYSDSIRQSAAIGNEMERRAFNATPESLRTLLMIHQDKPHLLSWIASGVIQQADPIKNRIVQEFYEKAKKPVSSEAEQEFRTAIQGINAELKQLKEQMAKQSTRSL